MRSIHLCGIIACVLVLSTRTATALAPRFISDEELAHYPVIVVAQWDLAPFKSNHRRDERDSRTVITDIESYTKLNVLRVIKGDIKPGLYTIMVGSGISWRRDGKWVTSGTSTELFGDVENVTERRIWFLQRQASWDSNAQTAYLSISNYRAIQPLTLEDYFSRLAQPNSQTEIPKLLSSTNSAVVRRALQYVCAGVWPWPYDSDFDQRYLAPAKKGELLRNQSEAVAGVVGRMELRELRAMALAVYAQLKGPKCSDVVHPLLGDRDPAVRTVAACILVRNRHESSIESINRAKTKAASGPLACKLIEAISAWDARLVPALARFLESGQFSYQYGDDLGIPAVKARNALHHVTGHWFPFDINTSMRAWDAVSHIKNFEQRRKELARILPNDPNPLRAEVLGGGHTNAICKITNKSQQQVAITELPLYVDQNWPAGSSSYQASRKDDQKVIVLDPGDSTSFPVRVDASFLLANSPSRELKLLYHMGPVWQKNGWVGWLKCVRSALERERQIETINEEP